MTAGGAKWYVAHTHAHAEAKAALNLRRQGYAVFFPRYRKRRRHARRIEIVSAPLFPRYVFVLVDRATQRWRAIGSTFGVAHLVCLGDEPAVVPDKVIAELQEREDSQGLVNLDSPMFIPGAKVRVRSGAFGDSLGLCEGMTDRERVVVLLDLLGRKVRVVMGVEAIEAA
jgi:transcriptional antiterminator RfaH